MRTLLIEDDRMIGNSLTKATALELIALTWAVWAFVVGHASMALWHWARADARGAQPDTGAS